MCRNTMRYNQAWNFSYDTRTLHAGFILYNMSIICVNRFWNSCVCVGGEGGLYRNSQTVSEITQIFNFDFAKLNMEDNHNSLPHP